PTDHPEVVARKELPVDGGQGRPGQLVVAVKEHDEAGAGASQTGVASGRRTPVRLVDDPYDAPAGRGERVGDGGEFRGRSVIDDDDRDPIGLRDDAGD